MSATRTEQRETKGRALAFGFLVVAFVAMVLLAANPAHADAFTVNSTGDEGNAPPSGVCNTAPFPEGTLPECTLRAAIQEANANDESDTITFSPSLSGTITLTLGELQIANNTTPATNDLIIQGPGARTLSVSGNNDDRVFQINPSAHVTISGLTISRGNVTGGIGGDGGGIYNLGTLTLTDSTVSGNTAAFGGGIANEGDLTLTDSTVSGNTALGGGGIYNLGTLTLSNSTISGNTASNGGGGIRISGGTVTLTNSTISGNTVSGNTATSTGGGIDKGAGGVGLRNTIVARNTATAGPDASGTFTSHGNNLIGNTTGSSGWGTSDLQNQDPLLGPLQNNGGPTNTHALLGGSPAIDRGANAGCPPTDQRGVSRPLDGNADGNAFCDIGAFERRNSPPVARNDSYNSREDTILRVPARGVLRNDADADGDALRAARVSSPRHGKLTLRPNGAFTYKPKKNFNGVVKFVYRTSDGHGGTDTATVTLRIKARPG